MHKHLFILLFSTLVFCTANIHTSQELTVPLNASFDHAVETDDLICTANIHTSQASTVSLSSSSEESSGQRMGIDDFICSIKTIITTSSLGAGLFTTTIIAIDEEGFGVGSAISTATTLFVGGAPWMVDFIRRKYKRVYQNI